MTRKRTNKNVSPRIRSALIRLPIIARSILLVVLLGMSIPSYAQQEFFPFNGKINVKTVHVRAGQSTNFESLGLLNKDAAVVVVERSFSWYKVRLPKTAKSYITREYVLMLGNEVGEVTADRVNIRGGAGINFSVLGQVSSGDRVIVVDDSHEEWVRIRPAPETYGWIREDFIEFVSSAQEQDRWLDDKELAKINKAQRPAPPQSTSEPQSDEADGEEIVEDPVVVQTAFTGVLTKSGDDNGFEYTLVNNGDGTYYLDGFSQLLKPFVNYRVKIEGHLKPDPAEGLEHPVIVVSRIQLIL